MQMVETVEVTENPYLRQLDIFDPAKFTDVQVIIIGAGSVGSFVTFTLAKMGLNRITVYDDDVVEEHNIPNQLYTPNDVGKPKVFALSKLITDLCWIGITPINHKFDIMDAQDIVPSAIVISAVDNMEARRSIWANIRSNTRLLYIDTRVGAELIRIFTVQTGKALSIPSDTAKYENTLTQEGIHLPCTARSIIYNIISTATLTANIVKRYLTSQQIPKEIIFNMTTNSLVEIPYEKK